MTQIVTTLTFGTLIIFGIYINVILFLALSSLCVRENLLFGLVIGDDAALVANI